MYVIPCNFSDNLISKFISMSWSIQNLYICIDIYRDIYIYVNLCFEGRNNSETEHFCIQEICACSLFVSDKILGCVKCLLTCMSPTTTFFFFSFLKVTYRIQHSDLFV